MTSNRNTRCFIVTLLLAFSLTSSYAQVIWAETFSDPDAATTEWQSGGTNEGTQIWSWHNDPSEAYAPQPFAAPSASDGYFMFESENNGYNAHNVTLTGPVFNCSASINTRISFWAQYMYFSAPNAELQVSVDGGDTWTGHILFEDLWPEQLFNGKVTIDVPEADGQSNVRLRFVWAGYHEYMWKIDDISLFNADVVAPMPCQQDPNAVICDNLDIYNTTLKLGVQANWWTTWFGAEGDVNDGTVCTEAFNSPPNALKIVSTSPWVRLRRRAYRQPVQPVCGWFRAADHRPGPRSGLGGNDRTGARRRLAAFDEQLLGKFYPQLRPVYSRPGEQRYRVGPGLAVVLYAGRGGQCHSHEQQRSGLPARTRHHRSLLLCR